MEKLDIEKVRQFVNDNIIIFHEKKINRLRNIKLQDILRKKNPYLFRAKNILLANDLIGEILDAYLYSSEEKIFGDFFEELAIYIASETCGGRKSVATGIDLELVKEDTFYIISIKSGMNWGNASQHRKQREDFDRAVNVYRQHHGRLNIQAVLGICYGKAKTTHLHNYLKVVGQSFWFLISGDENLYTDIIKPLGYKAKEFNDHFAEHKAVLINQFTYEFIDLFCKSGKIDWIELVRFNSSNL